MRDILWEIARQQATASLINRLERKINLSAAIEVVITARGSNDPLVQLLIRLRDEAAEAMVDLAEVEPTATAKIRELQGKVLRFGEVCTIVKTMVAEGFEADEKVSEESRQEIADLIAGRSIDDGEDEQGLQDDAEASG